MAATLPSRTPAQQRIFPVQQSSELCKISGIVKDSQTGQPIERALVNGQLDAGLTDNEGHFELHLPCGGYTQLQLRRPGYSDAQGADAYPVRVEPDAPEITLNLTPMATITGHVSVSNGGDSSGLFVRAFKSEYRNGRPSWHFAGQQAKTDSNGTFRMYGLESPAKYLLCSQQAQEHSGVPSTTNVTYGYPATCYPSALGTGGDGLLALARGQHAEVEISITRQPFHRVSIAASSPQAEHQSFDLHSYNGANVNASIRWREDDKSWEAWLPNGTYYAEARSWGESPAYGRVDFKVADTAVSGIRMSVLPLAPIEVLVHRLFTAKRNEQQINEADPGLQLELIPVERSLEGFGGGVGLRHSEEEAPGHFEAMGVTPGRYWIHVPWVQGGYVGAISSGSTDLIREPLVIGPGNTVPPIEVTIRNDGGSIDCTVNNAPSADGRNAFGVSLRPLSGPTVYAIPTGTRLSGFPQAQIWGPGGNARFENLAPGVYRVVVLSKFKDLNTVDPTELASLMAQGKSVSVEAGESSSVRVDLAEPEGEEPNP